VLEGTDNFALCKIVDGVLDVGVEVDDRDYGVGPTVLNGLDVLRDAHLDYFFPRNILDLLALLLAVLAAPLLVVELLPKRHCNIPDRLPTRKQRLNGFKVSNDLFFPNSLPQYLVILRPKCSLY